MAFEAANNWRHGRYGGLAPIPFTYQVLNCLLTMFSDRLLFESGAGSMARTAAGLPSGRRTSDFISLGVIAKTFPIAKVREVLAETGKASVRQRELPAHVMVYYVIAMALFMNVSCREVLRCLLEGLQWLKGWPTPIKVTGKSGISQARTRLGDEVVRRLHDEIVRPIATPSTKGAWFKHWRLVSLDGSTLDVADEPALEAAFGRPGVGQAKAPIRKSASSLWSRMARMSCSERAWRAARRARSP